MNEDVAKALAPVLGEAAARDLAERFQVVTVEPGEALFVEGEVSQRLLIVLEGELVVSVGQGDAALELARRGPGTWMGEIGLLDGGPASVTARAATRLRAVEVDPPTLNVAQREAPMATAALLRQLSRVMALRIAEGSAGIVEEVGPGHLGLKRPTPSKGWFGRMMDKLVGSDAP